jgi:hypothetical protein
MRRFLLLSVLILSLGSCGTMYKSGQTPDDVYFSPAQELPVYVESEANRNNDDEYLSDRYLRMKSSNRNRWSAFDDDFMYWNNPSWNNQFYFNSFRNPWAFNNPWGWNNPWAFNNPWAWNGGMGMGMGWGWNSGIGMGFGWNNWGWGNPMHPGFWGNPVIITRPMNPRAYTPRGGSSSLSTFAPRTYIDPKTGSRTYNLGSSPRQFRNSSGSSYYTSPSYRSPRTYSGSNGERYNAPSRSFDRGSSNGSFNSAPRGGGGSGSGSSGTAPVRSFPRGGN